MNCTLTEYHADAQGTIPALSRSVAHTMLTQSPLHAWSAHPRLGAVAERDSTDATDRGEIIHKLLLGKGAEIEIVQADDWRTKLAREARDLARELGRVPVLEHKFAEIGAAAAILADKLQSRGIFLDGQSEVPIEYWEQGEHGPVRCKVCFDHLMVDNGTAYDVKSSYSANPIDCAKSFYNHGSDIQWSSYTRALAQLRPEFEGRVKMFFLYLELNPPYDLIVAEPDGAMKEIGINRWNRAVLLWERCLRANRWPGYSDGNVVRLEPPAWILKQEMEGQHADW